MQQHLLAPNPLFSDFGDSYIASTELAGLFRFQRMNGGDTNANANDENLYLGGLLTVLYEGGRLNEWRVLATQRMKTWTTNYLILALHVLSQIARIFVYTQNTLIPSNSKQ